MSFTLAGWKTTTVSQLIASLPLQTYDEALPIVEAYLSDAGGWTPDDSTDPTGLGQPANGATPTVAVAAIVTERLDYIQNLSATISVNLTLDFIANLVPNQTQDDIIAQMTPALTEFVQTQLAKTAMNYSSINSITGTAVQGGSLTAAQRVTINTTIAEGTFKQDARAVAVNAARNNYGLDTLWNAHTLYNEQDKPIVVVVRAYTALDYETLDDTITNQYVMTVNRETYDVAAGVTTSV